MSRFKRLTLSDDGDHAVEVNLDQVLYLKRGGHSTTVYFSRDHWICVREEPQQIAAMAQPDPVGAR